MISCEHDHSRVTSMALGTRPISRRRRRSRTPPFISLACLPDLVAPFPTPSSTISPTVQCTLSFSRAIALMGIASLSLAHNGCTPSCLEKMAFRPRLPNNWLIGSSHLHLHGSCSGIFASLGALAIGGLPSDLTKFSPYGFIGDPSSAPSISRMELSSTFCPSISSWSLCISYRNSG